MVPAEADLSQVTVEVLSTHVVKNAFFDTLKHGTEGFGSIDMNRTADVLAFAVDDALMTSKRFGNVFVAVMTIAHDHCFLVNGFSDYWTEFTDFITGNLLSPHGALALGGDQHSVFTCAASPFVFHSRLVARLATNIGFVKFYDTGQFLVKHGRHHLPDGVSHTPRSWL